ncbi:hypothetical protein HPP92_010278 [Vanilla planifolia]|uniref:Uncharacterized protein n=1 Tax=Vanilla planifolia TaxID=51239 RepID=A0A835R0L2_VANPL|nr:hypothetical protein HPP92_010278 [Vanilla planifolia]
MAKKTPSGKLLLLIRDFAAEKSKGGFPISRSVSLDRQAHFETASNELERPSGRGRQPRRVAWIARLSSIEPVHRFVRRDEFIRAMQELNVKIRKFHERAFQALKACNAEVQTDMSIETANSDQTPKLENENNLKDLRARFCPLMLKYVDSKKNANRHCMMLMRFMMR